MQKSLSLVPIRKSLLHHKMAPSGATHFGATNMLQGLNVYGMIRLQLQWGLCSFEKLSTGGWMPGDF